uniref:hypothetical protein n=1 Tax=Falsiroseomonas oryzae TaxID=2766473 RepID=UPI0022EB1E6D
MREILAQRAADAVRGRAMAAVAEFADGGLAERMRLDAATRVLVTARRLLSVAPREAASGAAAGVVMRVARSWDPAATTAAEHVEALPLAELDAFLAAAPRWAAGVRDA